MAVFDVCNGDADGLCAALQWRLADPQPATLVTGLKREIALLRRLPARRGDEVNVFDLALPANQVALAGLLGDGVRVRYFDHHVGDAPAHPLLEACIDARADICTSLLVDARLAGRFRPWALVGAYGDNLTAQADALAPAAGLDGAAAQLLRRLGEAINYNAYGEDLSDVLVPPARLHALMRRHAHPLDMMRDEPVAAELVALREADLARARARARHVLTAGGSIYLLPDVRWARRVLGAYANALAGAEPARAHAVLLERPGHAYAVSLRAPRGAHEFCHRFGGAGRARAAGIDSLPGGRFGDFIDAFARGPWTASPWREVGRHAAL